MLTRAVVVEDSTLVPESNQISSRRELAVKVVVKISRLVYPHENTLVAPQDAALQPPGGRFSCRACYALGTRAAQCHGLGAASASAFQDTAPRSSSSFGGRKWRHFPENTCPKGKLARQ